MEKKIDRRIKYRAVVDTETCPIDKDLTDVVPSNMWTYDFGFAIVDKNGNVYEAYSFVNADIFIGERELMKSAYYANKIPQYWEDIKKYNVSEIYAHNMLFDCLSLNNTIRWISKSKYRYFFPYGLEICDTLKMARDVILKMPTYKRFCIENGYVTKNGQLRATAEILYRFIKKDNDFIESHTALEDVLIEKEILAYCFKQHKKMRRLLWEN